MPGSGSVSECTAWSILWVIVPPEKVGVDKMGRGMEAVEDVPRVS